MGEGRDTSRRRGEGKTTKDAASRKFVSCRGRVVKCGFGLEDGDLGGGEALGVLFPDRSPLPLQLSSYHWLGAAADPGVSLGGFPLVRVERGPRKSESLPVRSTGQRELPSAGVRTLKIVGTRLDLA